MAEKSEKQLVVGILAHVDSGKTTLSEAMLYRAGSIRKLGRVDHQDAFLDTDRQERERGITIFSKQAKLYLLDEPIGGVDPAARDYILSTILNNYSRDATVILSTHLIGDIEPILDEAVFLKDGRVFAHRNAEELRETEGMSVDAYFREVFKC